MYYFMENGPNFTGLVWLNAGGIVRDHMSYRFSISCLVPEIFAIKVGSCVKSVQILHVFDPQFFRGGPPRIFEHGYLIGADTDHVVKFRGDWPRELGGPLAN